MDRACWSTACRPGYLLPGARVSLELNEIIVEKAVKYRRRGVVGIDLAGTDRTPWSWPAEV